MPQQKQNLQASWRMILIERLFNNRQIKPSQIFILVLGKMFAMVICRMLSGFYYSA